MLTSQERAILSSFLAVEMRTKMLFSVGSPKPGYYIRTLPCHSLTGCSDTKCLGHHHMDLTVFEIRVNHGFADENAVIIKDL
jgi:hypothetical protein